MSERCYGIKGAAAYCCISRLRNLFSYEELPNCYSHSKYFVFYICHFIYEQHGLCYWYSFTDRFVRRWEHVRLGACAASVDVIAWQWLSRCVCACVCVHCGRVVNCRRGAGDESAVSAVVLDLARSRAHTAANRRAASARPETAWQVGMADRQTAGRTPAPLPMTSSCWRHSCEPHASDGRACMPE